MRWQAPPSDLSTLLCVVSTPVCSSARGARVGASISPPLSTRLSGKSRGGKAESRALRAAAQSFKRSHLGRRRHVMPTGAKPTLVVRYSMAPTARTTTGEGEPPSGEILEIAIKAWVAERLRHFMSVAVCRRSLARRVADILLRAMCACLCSSAFRGQLPACAKLTTSRKKFVQNPTNPPLSRAAADCAGSRRPGAHRPCLPQVELARPGANARCRYAAANVPASGALHPRARRAPASRRAMTKARVLSVIALQRAPDDA